jgi:hypothetical protein
MNDDKTDVYVDVASDIPSDYKSAHKVNDLLACKK